MWWWLIAACVHKPDALPSCPAASTWAAGDKLFVERAAEIGLEGVQGVRLTAVDFDQDGWTDLHVARGPETADDFAEGGVRNTWLLRNDHGTFVDITESSGFRQARRGNGARLGMVVAWADVDNDGDRDAYTGVSDSTGSLDDDSEIVINRGDGSFELGPKGAVSPREADVPGGASFTDVDRDGLLDLWVTQGAENGYPLQDQLFLGIGGGDFSNATTGAGLTTQPWSSLTDLNFALAHSNAWSAASCDVNADGLPDLLAASYGRAPNHLWVQQPDGTFANRSIASGYAFDSRVDWSDNESARCWCELHPSDAGCDGVPPAELIACEEDADAFRWDHDSDREAYRLGGNSGTTVCNDVDNDGDLDLLTTEIVHWDVGSSSDPSELLFNDGAGVFSRPGNEVTGLIRTHDIVSWNDGDITGAILDVDNDGWQDVLINSTDYLGTRSWLWRQISPGQFEPVALADGPKAPRAHGVAVADFDHDGDLDMVIGTSLGRCDDDCPPDADVRYFENQSSGASIRLDLVGSAGSNRDAIGARVTVKAGDTVQTRVVDGGHGHYGLQHEHTLHFGVADACEAQVTVHWPDAAGTISSQVVRAGQTWIIQQGQPPAARP